MNRLSILEVVGERVSLRHSGKEFVGLCPFHNDKRPSFNINAEKGVFHCFGCGASGDVIKFVMLADELSFPEACKALGIDGRRQRPARRISPNYKAADLLASWLNEQHLLIGARCRKISRLIAIAKSVDSQSVARALLIRWEILSILHDDLQNPRLAAELWESRNSIETLTSDVEPEPIEPFPALTDSYREYLRSVVQC